MAALLDVQDLAFSYSRERGNVFSGVTFSVEKGEGGMLSLLREAKGGVRTIWRHTLPSRQMRASKQRSSPHGGPTRP